MNPLFEWFAKNWQALVTSLLSIIAIAVSIVAFLKSQRTQKRLLEIEEDRRRDEKSAQLIVQFHRDGSRRVLRIWNKGNGEARNIRLRIDGQNITEHPCWLSGNQPILVLSGGNHADCLLSVTMRGPVPKEAEVFWDDDICQGKSSRSTLTL